ncbi:MAG TPA: sigma-70 family RNA polymerase sigma factor [Gammaproteobacteria bacterium]|nr:sigma-70 family RNA polymerase sigma factor [Gammaproteobacteria bacterium]
MTNTAHRNRVLTRLLSDIATGDREAFARLYRLTSPNLYAVALRILKDESRAQDCLQDTYLKIWQQTAAYDGGKAAVMTWLSVIVRHRALDMLRRRHEHHGEAVEPDTLPSWPEVDPVDRMALEKCLRILDDRQRECLVLAYHEGLTHPELAARLALPLGTVKTWIRRGLEKLRQCLQ